MPMVNIPMLVTKTILLASTGASAVLSAVDNPVEAGKTLGSLNTAEILGIVAFASVLALVALYRDARKDNAKLVALIEANTRSNQQVADAMTANSQILVEVKDAIVKCAGPKKPP